MAQTDDSHPPSVEVVPLAVSRALSTAQDYPSHIRFNPPRIILTPRLYLRRATEDDISAIHRFLTQEETMRYMASKVSQSLADTEHWYKTRFVKDPVSGKGGGDFIYLICLRDGDNEGEAIGTCGSKQVPHLGYQIGAGPRYWGKGYASEAVGAILNGVCKEIQQKKVENWDKAYIRIEVEDANVGSVRVAEKIGAKKFKERTQLEDSKLIHEYRVYVKDWTPV